MDSKEKSVKNMKIDLDWYRQDNRYSDIKPATHVFQIDVYAVNQRIKKYLWPGETFITKTSLTGSRMFFVGRQNTPIINDPKLQSINKILREEYIKYELKRIPWPRNYGVGYDEFWVPSLRKGDLVLMAADYLLRLVERAHVYISINFYHLPPWYSPVVLRKRGKDNKNDKNDICERVTLAQQMQLLKNAREAHQFYSHVARVIESQINCRNQQQLLSSMKQRC